MIVAQQTIRQGKRITVFVNGDRYMRGKMITLNTHDTPDFGSFCSFLNEHVPCRTGGCYRRIFTPEGSEIRDLDEIEAGLEYVISKDGYTKIAQDYGYREIPERTRPIYPRSYRKIDIHHIITPVEHALEPKLRQSPGRSHYLNENTQGLLLRVHINGMNERPFFPVAILHKDKYSLEKIFKTIEGEIIQKIFDTRPIKWMYRIDGLGGDTHHFTEITDPSQIQPNEHVLVRPYNDPHVHPFFYPLGGMSNFRVATAPKVGQHYSFNPFPPRLLRKRARYLPRTLKTVHESPRETIAQLPNLKETIAQQMV